MKKVIIIGAGPAGLTSGLILSQAGYQVKIFEGDSQYVGGLSKTVVHGGFRFDIGGHRFYTRDPQVRAFWLEVLGDDLLRRERKSRIYYKGQLLNYPLQLKDILLKLPRKDFASFALSWLQARLKNSQTSSLSFEHWMKGRFGEKLYQAFFKDYSEKVWGRSCQSISADWADQRIQNLSPWHIIKNIFSRTQIKSLISHFEYPKLGPGMFWEKVADLTKDAGGEIYLGVRVNKIKKQNEKWMIGLDSGVEESADYLISSMPLAKLLTILHEAPAEVRSLAESFEYRSFITVAIMFRGKNPFDEQWIYIQEPEIRVARIQNYKNWSPFMVPDESYCCLGLEYFCQSGDEFWRQPDEELFKLALKELKILGISYSESELDFKVIRQPYAYPIYDLTYRERLDQIKSFIGTQEKLYCIGRTGLHRYNNQDHSIKTAMLVCENVLKEQNLYDPWLVNQDAEYIEEASGPINK